MYKGKDQLSLSKSGVLKGELAVGRPAGASVLCLFPIPWPEAMVCIFRTTAGYRQAGDLSSGFITAHKMTLASLWSQLRLWSAAKPLPLPANPTLFFCPRTPRLIAPNLSSVSVCTALPSRTAENQALPPCLLVGLYISRETEKSCICPLDFAVQPTLSLPSPLICFLRQRLCCTISWSRRFSRHWEHSWEYRPLFLQGHLNLFSYLPNCNNLMCLA